MKIDKFEAPKGITIKDLQAGDCFTHSDTKIIWMKTSDREKNNIISLTNGYLTTIHEDTEITPLPNATVTFPKVEKPKEEVKKWYDFTLAELGKICDDVTCSLCPLRDYGCIDIIQELVEKAYEAKMKEQKNI